VIWQQHVGATSLRRIADIFAPPSQNFTLASFKLLFRSRFVLMAERAIASFRSGLIQIAFTKSFISTKSRAD